MPAAEEFLEADPPSAEAFLSETPTAESFLDAPSPQVSRMASATSEVVGLVGRAIAATDIALEGANAPDALSPYQPDESSLAPIPDRGLKPARLLPAMASTFAKAMTTGIPFPKVSAQEVSDAFSMLASGSPDLTEEEANAIIEHTTKPGNLEKIVAGAQRAITSVPEGFTSPFGLATVGAGALPGTLGRAVAGGFAVDMASHIPAQVQQLKGAISSGDSERITESAGNLLASSLMTAATAKHATLGPTLPEVAPLTAEATARAITPAAPASIAKSATPLTTAAVESVKGPRVETSTPTPAAAASESGTSPVTAGAPPAKVEVAQVEPVAKLESEQPLTTEPAIIGMGGAIPEEFATGRQTATGIKNAVVDQERQARGQPPIVKVQRIGNEATWDAAMAHIDRDPAWQDRLVDELKTKPRTPSAEEIVALDHRYADLQNEYAKATRDGAQHYKDQYADGVQEAKARADFYEGKLAELEQVARAVGAEWGRSGQMRQRLLKEDFTLEAMEAKARAAKGFEPLTEAEHAEIRDLHTKLQEAEAKAASVEAATNEKLAMLEAQKALAEARAQSATAYEPRVLAAAEKFASFMDKKGADALQRIKQRLGRTSAGIDPTILSDVAILGASKITRGLVDFAKWTDAMTRDLGEWFKEHAQEAWDASQKYFGVETETFHKGVDSATKAKIRRASTVNGRMEDVKASIKTKAAAGEGSPLHSDVRKLSRLLVEQNHDITRDQLIDTIHGILKESMPEITRLEAMDAISGRGRFWTPDQREVSKTLRDLSQQIRLVAHQIDVEAGRPMPRTGYQPDKMSPAAKAEQSKLNDLMRKYGVKVTDPATQLGAALDALKTRLEREKADLTRRLAEGDFSPRRKAPRELPIDETTAASKAEVERLRGDFKQQLAKFKYDQKTRGEKIWHGIKTARNAIVNIASSYDFSAPRQALFAILSNVGRLITSPIKASRMLAKPVGQMFRAWASEKTAAMMEQQRINRPNAKSGADKIAEVHYSELNSEKFTKYEENAHSILDEWAKLPLKTGNLAKTIATAPVKLAARGVRASNRAFITFLNSTRADLLDELLATNYKDRAPTDAELKVIGNLVNIATGRGKLPPKGASVASNFIWSPYLLASRVQVAVGQPLWTGKWAESGRARKIVAKEYARAIMSGYLLWNVSRLFDDKDEKNLTSSDFGKIVRGNTRIDPWGGLQQITTLAARTASATTTTLKGKERDIGAARKYGQRGIWHTWADFGRSKLRPDVGAFVDVVTRSDFQGKPTTLKHVTESTLVPLPMRDIVGIMKEHGFTEGMIIEALGQFGAGVSQFEEKEAQR